jgi:hypothetical protein
MSVVDDPAGAVSLDWLDPDRALEVLAVLHATVDLERALVERGASPADAAGAVPDELLGARVVVVGGGGPTPVAVAEPSTEGRLAATLARHDEGIVGRYMRAPFPLGEVRTRAGAAGVVLSRPAAGPFGDEVVVGGSRLGGPQVILVDPGRVPSPG